MSGAMASVVVSIPTHKSARCWLAQTSDVAARKPSRHPANHRPPRGLSSRKNPIAYATTAANSRLTSVRTRRPSESTASHPLNAEARGPTQSAPTMPRCARLTTLSTTSRALGRVIAKASADPIAGSSTTSSTSMRASGSRFSQLHEILRRDRIELAVDVEHDDSHDEHGDEHVEQHTDFDEERDPLHQRETKQVYAILEHQVADHLRDRLAARDQHEQSAEERHERHRNEQPHWRVLTRADRGKAVGDAEGETRCNRPEQQRPHVPDHRLDLAPHRCLAH